MTNILDGATSPSKINEDKHDKKSCPFCPEEDKSKITNKLVNNSTTLGNNCATGDTLGKSKPATEQYLIIYKHPKTREEDLSAVTFQAHHCIPGNDALKSEKANGYKHKILKYIEAEKNTITSDIGYDVNNNQNGIWLCNKPNHFIGRMKDDEWVIYPKSGMKWGELSKSSKDKQYEMAKSSMIESDRQFHDSHSKYSKEVRKRLTDLMDELKEEKMECPIESENKSPDVRPPYGLITKLNNLSEDLAETLVGPASEWYAPYYTSKFSKKLADEIN